MGSNWQYYSQAGGNSEDFDWGRYANQGGTQYQYGNNFEDIFGNSGYSDFFDMFFGGSFGGKKSKRGGGRRAPQKGQDFQASLDITLREAYTGVAKVFTFNNQSIKLNIKPGISDGHMLKLSGKGGTGAGGAGDLLIRINVLHNSIFERKGDDLYANLYIPLYDAVLGGKVEFETIKGKVKIDVTRDCSNGKIFRLAKLGMPKYGKTGESGDLYLTVTIELPRNLSEREIELFTELKKLRK